MSPVLRLTALFAASCLAATDDVALFQGSVRLKEEMPAALDRPRRRRHRRSEPEEETKVVTSRNSVEQFGVSADAELVSPSSSSSSAVAELLDSKPNVASASPKVESEVPKAASEGSQNVTMPTGPYQVGESAEVLDVSSGVSAGDWVGCTIKARGSVPGTFDIHIPVAPEGQQEWSNVPGKFLRRPDPSAPRRAFFSYEVGDDVEVKSVSGPRAGSWVPASVSKKGPLPETYGIHLPLGAPGHQELADIPATFLRKLDKAKFSEEMKSFAVSPENAMDMSMRKEFRDTWLAGELRHLASAYTAPASFAESEEAEIQIPDGPMRGGWAPCTVLGAGEKEKTYNVRVPVSGEVKDINGVPVHMLRKVHSAAPLEMYKAGEVAEVQVKDGPHQGDWVKVSVLREGSKPGLYDLSTGFEEIHDIPVGGLRKVAAVEEDTPI